MSKGDKYDEMTRDELYEIAKEKEISGKSKMKKEELKQAIKAQEGRGGDKKKSEKSGSKLGDKEKRKRLVNFIDNKVFDPIMKANPDKFSEKDRETVEKLIKDTKDEKELFHKDYNSAKEVKNNYLQNTTSRAGKKVNKQLQDLGLPSLAGYKDEFKELCNELGVK